MSVLSSGTVRGVLNAATITGVIGNGIARVDGSTDPYLGEYEVTPKVDAPNRRKSLRRTSERASPFLA